MSEEADGHVKTPDQEEGNQEVYYSKIQNHTVVQGESGRRWHLFRVQYYDATADRFREGTCRVEDEELRRLYEEVAKGRS